MQKRRSIDSRKNNYRRKRLIIAYGLRIAALLVLALLIVLIVCGCFYIHNLFQGKKTSAAYRQSVNQYNASQGEERFSYGTDKSTVKSLLDKNNNSNVIVLDAGHGGTDVGTLSGEVYEKDITISVVKKMKRLLEEQGMTVVLTREDDSFVALEERYWIANEAEADLFVSIHCNYFEDDASVSGLECYYQEGSTEGRQMAEGIIADLADSDEIAVRSAKAEDFSVLRNTEMPAVLVELGFLSNREECKRLTRSEYQDTLAKYLVESIMQKL